MRFLFGILLLSLGASCGPLMAQNQKASDKASLAGLLIPSGTIMPFAGSTAPAGWVFAAGQEYNTTGTYAKLFAVIGSTYCTNDHGGGGSCTAGVFRIPDMRGRFVGGKDNMNGIAANRITSAKTFDGTVLGKAGGSQSIAGHYHAMVASSTLSVDINHDHPSATVSGTAQSGVNLSHPHTINDPTHAHDLYSVFNVASGGAQTAMVNSGTAQIGTQGKATGITINNSASLDHSHTVSGSTDLPALGATAKTPTGSVGLVTGGCDGNTDSCNNLSPTIILNYIIKT